MARRRKSSARGPLVSIALLAALAVLAFIAWRQGWMGHVRFPGTASAPTEKTGGADHVDTPLEGKRITLDGVLRVVVPARDPQLGVTADAVALLRTVEMLQWHEQCVAGRCDYHLAWSATPVDSNAFRDPHAHANPTRFPFASARFTAGEVRLDAYRIAPDLAAEGAAARDFPVHGSSLPPNLAATFRERDGVLYAGVDPAHAAAGDLRVSYRIVPAGPRRIDGVLEGGRIVPLH